LILCIEPNIELYSNGVSAKNQSVSNSLHTFNKNDVKDLTAKFDN